MVGDDDNGGSVCATYIVGNDDNGALVGVDAIGGGDRGALVETLALVGEDDAANAALTQSVCERQSSIPMDIVQISSITMDAISSNEFALIL